jgi:hypothetical protein
MVIWDKVTYSTEKVAIDAVKRGCSINAEEIAGDMV